MTPKPLLGSFGAGLLGAAALGLLFLWFRVPADPALVVLVGPGVGLAATGLLSVLGLGVVAFLLLVRRRRSTLLLALGLLACAAFDFVWVRRYTVGGVFALGGSHYWVSRAAHEPSDTVAAQYLRVSLSATQYGVKLTENAVVALKQPAEEARLFGLLAGVAPNDHWSAQYRLLATGWRRNVPAGK